jgi:hypothetical protein
MFIRQITNSMIKNMSKLEASDLNSWAVFCNGSIVYLTSNKTKAERVLKEIS